MRINWRICSLGFLVIAAAGCNGNVLSRTAPASDWTSSTQSRQLAPPLYQPDKQKGFMDVHDFGGAGDGSQPNAGVVPDKKGNVYGTTVSGGMSGAGTVWEAIPPPNGTWNYSRLYSFKGGTGDGSAPYGSVTIAVSEPGTPPKLVGMTSSGGLSGLGTVFQIRVKGKKSTESIVYNFQGSLDGTAPFGDLLRDKSGDFYGLTSGGGVPGLGTAFKLTPSGAGYSESVLHAFSGVSGGDGASPVAGLIADANGNLFGTTQGGGNANCSGGCGTVFELMPSGSNYTEMVLYSFQDVPDGRSPASDLTIDTNGNLYGTTTIGGSSLTNGGTVFELRRGKSALSPRQNSDVTYSESVLYDFQGGSDGLNPGSCVVMDKKGDLYGTTIRGGGASGLGTVFELAPNHSGGWSESIVHSFQGGATDGANPVAGLLRTQSGGFVVPTTAGGLHGGGMVGSANYNSSRSNVYCR